MKIDEIMKNIVASSTYKKEIGTSFQLGLPQFFCTTTSYSFCFILILNGVITLSFIIICHGMS